MMATLMSVQQLPQSWKGLLTPAQINPIGPVQ
jgi:hypothetical protein